ncbi:RNA 2',3'-cyclic phosphodiesterase [Virgibacillus sp. C22-A2]|uniref:RNA 2',3'-cyclic phosphodiesterase n=1 Tax=Virgibacillus tibetensis TaxID=3042313 RepID=A0ABU6KBP4_9BACI|nr:RNA 2',3'-cyclic phosphodiesterase [Virgibacillus sp. C22-A2]
MSSSSHYFIAIPLPELLREQLSNWQDELRTKVSYKQWPHKQDLHITLKFLGAVADNKLDALQKELKRVEHINGFSTFAGQLGTFGNYQQPRVLWAGVEPSSDLLHLYELVESCAANAGFQIERRPYRPHITLAKKWANDSIVESIEVIKQKFSEKQVLYVGEIALYEIHPTRNPKYNAISRYRLRGGG